MTNAEKKAAKKCSIKDFVDKFSDPKYKTNKRGQFNDVVDYLARYGMNGSKVECSFDELLLTAKNMLLSQAAEQHLDQFNMNPYDHLGNMSMQEEHELRKFILYPMNTIKDKFKEYDPYRQLQNETDPDKIKYYKDLQANAKRIETQIRDYSDEVKDAKKFDSYVDVVTRIQAKLPTTTKSLDQALDNNRGGVFERVFSTTSKQYSNFKAAFKDFRNPNSVYLGDKNHLEKETKAYLHHVMPSYKTTDDLPTPEQFAQLSGTQKGRAAFCINVLKSIKEAKEVEPLKENVQKALMGDPEYKQGPIIIEHGEQNSFQSQIKDDVDKSSEFKLYKDIDKDESSLDNNLDESKIENNKDESELENDEMFNQLTK